MNRKFRRSPADAKLAEQLRQGEKLLAQGRAGEAAGVFAEIVRGNPRSALCFQRMGVALAHAGELEGALQALVRAVQLEPLRSDHLGTLVLLLQSTGQLARALRILEQLRPLCAEDAAWWVHRADLLLEQGDYAGSRALLEAAPAACRTDTGLLSEEIRAMLYDPTVTAADLYAQACSWETSARLPPPEKLAPLDPRPDRRLRIGLLNTRFHRHSISHHLRNWLPHRDRKEAEILLFSSTVREDATSLELASLSDAWIRLAGLDDAAAVTRLREARLDILVDMNEHANAGRLTLFSARCAPIQVHYFSNAVTTGLRAMDYRITDPLAESVEVDASTSSEQLLPLASGYHSYSPPVGIVAPCEQSPVESHGVLTFGGLHHLAKYNDVVLRTYARILAEVPLSRLLLVRDAFRCAETRAAFSQRCLAAGLPAGRVQLEPDAQGDLAAFNRFDVVLDSFPFNGDATTGDALWMGVPVVTVKGESLRARRAAAQLIRMGRSEWIGTDIDDMVAKAVKLGKRTPAEATADRRHLQRDARESSERQARAVAKELISSFRHIWQRTCRGIPVSEVG